MNLVRVGFFSPPRRKRYTLKTLHVRRQSFPTAARNRLKSPWRKISSASWNESPPFASVCAKTIWSGCRRHWFYKLSNKQCRDVTSTCRRCARSRDSANGSEPCVSRVLLMIGWDRSVSRSDRSVSRSASWRSGSAVPPPRCLCVWSLEDRQRIKPPAPSTSVPRRPERLRAA